MKRSMTRLELDEELRALNAELEQARADYQDAKNERDKKYIRQYGIRLKYRIERTRRALEKLEGARDAD